MIIFLRNEYSPRPRTDTVCCAIKATFVEFLEGRVEFIPAYGDFDVTQIDIKVTEHGDNTYLWGDAYDYCEIYDNSLEEILRASYPKCRWFEKETCDEKNADQ